MKYTFNITLNSGDIYNSSINYNKNSRTYIFDKIFTIVAFVVLIFTIYNGSFFNFDMLRKILLIICVMLFPIIQPIILYIKSILRVKKLGSFETTLIFDDEKITISAKNEVTTVAYENVYNFIKYKNMIVIMYDAIHGQIIPDRLNTYEKEKFFKEISDKIIVAREKVKNEQK